jgi:hypothetical protein
MERSHNNDESTLIFRLTPIYVRIQLLERQCKAVQALPSTRFTATNKAEFQQADVGRKRRTDSISKFWIIKMTFPKNDTG